MLTVDLIKNNLTSFLFELESVCRRCGRKKEDIKVVFATKYLNSEQLVEFINIAREMSITPLIIGENRVQEAGEKMEFIKIKSLKLLRLLKWIMIGNLQKNKINKALEIFEEIHSVDSLELVRAIDIRIKNPFGPSSGREQESGIKNGKMPIFLEVNVSGEESKHGFDPEKINETINTMLQFPNLKVKGLMTMAPHFEDPEKTRPVFRTLKNLADKYHLLTSMGMSSDWKVAVKEGADYIRIGSRIFS